MKVRNRILRLSILSLVIFMTSCNNYDMNKDAEEYGKIKCELSHTSSNNENYQKLKIRKDSLYNIIKERYYGNKEDKMSFKRKLINEKVKCSNKYNKYLSH